MTAIIASVTMLDPHFSRRNRSIVRIGHNSRTSLPPQAAWYGSTSFELTGSAGPLPWGGKPAPAYAAPANSAWNGVIWRCGNLFRPMVNQFYIIIAFPEIVTLGILPFLEKTKSTNCIADWFHYGNFSVRSSCYGVSSLPLPHLLSSWPQFPGPISIVIQFFRGAALRQPYLSGKKGTSKIFQAAPKKGSQPSWLRLWHNVSSTGLIDIKLQLDSNSHEYCIYYIHIIVKKMQYRMNKYTLHTV